MDPSKARDFITNNHRAVLITRRRNGDLQTSPVTVGVDDDGRAEISSRETAFKTKNLRRDPKATLCAFTDRFYGEWVQIEGRAEIVSLPEAMEGLVAYYRRIAGEHPDWDEYRAAMEKQKRVLIRIEIEKAGPDHSG